jgi:hypothetical protein
VKNKTYDLRDLGCERHQSTIMYKRIKRSSQSFGTHRRHIAYTHVAYP